MNSIKKIFTFLLICLFVSLFGQPLRSFEIYGYINNYSRHKLLRIYYKNQYTSQITNPIEFYQMGKLYHYRIRVDGNIREGNIFLIFDDTTIRVNTIDIYTGKNVQVNLIINENLQIDFLQE